LKESKENGSEGKGEREREGGREREKLGEGGRI